VPAVLFEPLDDPRHLSSHMERSSMAMLGTAMELATDALGGRAIGSVIRMRGRVLGLPLALDEVVTERVPPLLKAWETIGEPRLIVMGSYRLGFRIEPAGDAARLTVFIGYALPASRRLRPLARLLGPLYARWCCRRMLADATAFFARPAGSQVPAERARR
jgi:hypothetical protein